MKKIILFSLIALILTCSTLLYKALEQRLSVTAEETDVEAIQPPPQQPLSQALQLPTTSSVQSQPQTLSEYPVQEETSLPAPLDTLYQMHQQASQQPSPAVANNASDAKAAARQKYIEGLDAFNQDDLQTAITIWTQAHQLDPENTDVQLALTRAREMAGQL